MQITASTVKSLIFSLPNDSKLCQWELWLFLVLMQFHHRWQLLSGMRFDVISSHLIVYSNYVLFFFLCSTNKALTKYLPKYLEDNQEDTWTRLWELLLSDRTVLLGIRGASLNIGSCIHPCLVIQDLSIHMLKGSLTLCTYKDLLLVALYVYMITG